MKSPLQKIKELMGDDYIEKIKTSSNFLKKGKCNSKVSNKKILKALSKKEE